ncbi:Zinc finger, MYND-type [Dillenia turbinata]|uniref:Zinc finger, MYND-type n=1 Tax=Dillenia turbinata TaxID=194707 RepID=A0AAN8URA0_9MAGN
MVASKKQRIWHRSNEKSDHFDGLPDDIIICILRKLCSTASCPSDFISVLLTCKRLNTLGFHPLVLRKANPKSFAVRVRNWSESAHRFLKECAKSGNSEACYTLGMIEFYCLRNRRSGISLLAKAAIKSHARALYSLAVIQFNGSGGTKDDKNLRAGVILCAQAAGLGHFTALRELGHCLQDGYGASQNIAEGRRLLIQANTLEAMSQLGSMALPRVLLHQLSTSSSTSLVLNIVSSQEIDVANRFLVEWYGLRDDELGPEGLRMCSNARCGRPETRRHEFRRCSICGIRFYCSRGCQALDWKLKHKGECNPSWDLFFAENGVAHVEDGPVEQWFHAVDEGNDDVESTQDEDGVNTFIAI